MIQKHRHGKTEYFAAPDGHRYARIVGGLAWPHGGGSGFALVIAEDLNEDPAVKVPKLTVIKEVESADVGALVRRCQDWQAECLVQDWFCNTDNRPMLAVCYHLTENEPAPRRLNLYRASHANDPRGLGYYLPVIKEHLITSRKVLHFAPGSQLPGYLGQVGPELLNRNPEDYPAVAALGYALSYLYEHPRQEEEDEDYRHPHEPRGRSKVTGY